MERLTELQHDVIGDVDDRVDRAQTAAAQPFPHPGGRIRAHVDVADDACGEPRAALWMDEFDSVCIFERRWNGIDTRRLNRR